MRHCAACAWHAGFRRLTLLSTMPGVPFYRALGFTVDEHAEFPLADGMRVACAYMSRDLPRSTPD